MKIKAKLISVFLLVCLIPLMVTSIFSYIIAKRTLTQQVLNQLKSISVAQQNRLKSIIEQNLERLVLVSSRTQLRISLANYIKENSSAEQEKMNKILHDARSSITSFEDIHVLNLIGEIVASTSQTMIGTTHSNEEFFARGLKENCADLLFLDKTQNLKIYLSGPLYFEEKLIGVVAIKSNVDNIMSLVQNYSGLGKTGETLLAKRDKDGDALFIVPLRFDQHAALNRTVSKDNLNSPIIQALLGKEELFTHAVDYRGEPVLAATRYIEKTGWGLVTKIDKTEAYAPIVNLRNLFVLIILVTSVVSTFVSLYLARTISIPILNLTHAATEISEGNLSQKVEVTSTDEIGILARVFDKMTKNLTEVNIGLEQKVKERTAQLEKEIIHRKRAEEEIRKVNTELIVINKELEAFSYSVSHDLRAPLRSIDGFSQALLEDYPDKLDDQGKDYLLRLRSASQRMGQLIDDMLNLSRITRSEMRHETVDLSALVRTIVAELRTQHPERQVEFVIAQEVTANGDARLLQILLENLLSNAWKFTSTHSHARIEFGVTGYEDKLAYFVRDDGVGFDMAYADKLFTPFQRLHTMTEFPGTGVGLAIVQRIVHRHGGIIWAEGAPEQGATFYFTL